MSDSTEVAISLISRIKREREPVERTTVHALGHLFKKGTSYYLKYLEEVPQLGVSTHIIKIGLDHALIMRQGATPMRLPLVVGEETVGDYQSPAGAFTILAKAEKCQIEWTGQEGTILIAYKLHLQGQYVGKFSLEFKLGAR